MPENKKIDVLQKMMEIGDLIEQGKAYPCFCTPEEVEAIRAKQEVAKIRPGYYSRNRHFYSKS